jgi:hypothetical protein
MPTTRRKAPSRPSTGSRRPATGHSPGSAARPHAGTTRYARSSQTSSRHAAQSRRSRSSQSFLLRAFSRAWSQSRIFRAILIAFILILAVGTFDGISNFGKVYAGVQAGGIDIGGMTPEQAEAAVADKYQARIDSRSLTIYASQTAMDSHASNGQVADEDSVQEAQASTVSWSADAGSLQAQIDYGEIAQDAMAAGRGGILDRLSLFFGSRAIDIPIEYNQDCIETLAQNIDATLGDPYQDFGIQVADGIASVTDGHDGDMVDRNDLERSLSACFLPDDSPCSFVASVGYAPAHIHREAAQAAADIVNKAIAAGADFVCNDASWTVDASLLGSWIKTDVVTQSDGTFVLQPSFDERIAKSAILTHIQARFQNGVGKVAFEKSDGTVFVHAETSGTIPLVDNAVDALDAALIPPSGTSQKDDSVQSRTDDGTPIITIQTGVIPDKMTLDEALSYGIVTQIGTYTTTYTGGATARNANIHLAADLLDDSIVPADGGVWSFNDIAGECNAAKGFQSAGAIVEDETVDEIGGGICQVATTIFNAVYNAGYPIVERTNHSLYIASYPAGRDAAISWPTPDLKWSNDTSSDILVEMGWSDTTVTASLYGVDPGYKVTTTVGDWQAGKASATIYKYDSTIAKGTEYTKVKGSDGRKIAITRTVVDANGNVLRSTEFTSDYQPQDTVIVRGGSESDYPSSSS